MLDLQKPSFETVSLFLLMQKLTELSKNGILPFSEATLENKDNHIFYDSKTVIEKSIFFESYPMVEKSFIDKDHHKIMSTYHDYRDDDFIGHSYFSTIELVVVLEGHSADPYVLIKDSKTNISFMIHNGLCREV